MRQKYQIGERVKIAEKLPYYMSHFTANVEAIVQYTYSQAHGGKNIKDYSLGLIDDSGKIYKTTAWYKEDLLASISKDYARGMEMLEDYNFRE